MGLEAEIRELKDRIRDLEARKASNNIADVLQSVQQFPVFRSLSEYKDKENHPQNVRHTACKHHSINLNTSGG